MVEGGSGVGSGRATVVWLFIDVVDVLARSSATIVAPFRCPFGTVKAVNFPRSDGIKFRLFCGGCSVVVASSVCMWTRANSHGYCSFDSCGASFCCGPSILSFILKGVFVLGVTSTFSLLVLCYYAIFYYAIKLWSM